MLTNNVSKLLCLWLLIGSRWLAEVNSSVNQWERTPICKLMGRLCTCARSAIDCLLHVGIFSLFFINIWFFFLIIIFFFFLFRFFGWSCVNDPDNGRWKRSCASLSNINYYRIENSFDSLTWRLVELKKKNFIID